MTNFSTDKFTKPSEITGTLNKQPQEFKVGDIVESKQDIVAPEGSKGIIILEYVEGSPPDYDVYWYDSEIASVFREDIRHCGGIEEKNLCRRCEYNNLCPHLDEIVRCDISEFGEWRMEGEPDLNVCRQRKCKYLDVCKSENWLPDSG
jgi:hypothetical protein